MFTDSIYEHIWQGYKIFASASFVERSGHQLVGLADPVEAGESNVAMFRRRGESVLEHCAKTAYLLLALLSHFPGLFDSENVLGGKIPADTWMLVTTMLTHDIGELATGDIPDDGNAAHDTKDEIERRFYCKEMAPMFSWNDSVYLRESYIDFQERKTFVGQLLYCLDKLEAILGLLLLEEQEARGFIDNKPFPTMQDEHYRFLTGTPNAIDCWAAHTKDRVKDFPAKATRHIFGILRAAVMDVRGEWFAWWDNV